jgi:hypothetical protein
VSLAGFLVRLGDLAMKDLRTLLLGSAAGLVAVAAAHAADLPVKTKSTEYLKICSLYGAGFYYMAGTDLCMKIGGWVRAEATWGGNGNLAWGPFNGNVNNRLTSNEAVRARGNISADVRNQTEYGTIRSYIAVGLLTNDTGLQVANLVDFVNRAFVQWGGMTAGLSESFYDFYSSPAVAGLYGTVRGWLCRHDLCRRAPYDTDHRGQRTAWPCRHDSSRWRWHHHAGRLSLRGNSDRSYRCSRYRGWWLQHFVPGQRCLRRLTSA